MHSALGKELRALTSLAAPLALAQLGQASMNWVDVAVVGRVGAVPLAAVGLGNSIFFALSILGMGLVLGLDPLLSQAFGAKDEAKARRVLKQGTYLSLMASAALALPILLLPHALHPFGIELAVAEQAQSYVAWRLLGLPAWLLFFAYRGYLQAAGRPRPLLWASLLANLVNLTLDVLLVFGGASLPSWAGPLRHIPPLGSTGAAVATSIATAFQAAVVILAVRSLTPRDRFFRWPKLDLHILKTAARVGVPVGLHLFAEVAVFSMAGALAAKFGAMGAAAHYSALMYASLSFSFALGIGNAGSVRVGWAIGANDTASARRSGLAALLLGVVVMSIPALAFLSLPGPLARILTNQSEVAMAIVPLLQLAGLFQLSDGVQAVGAGILRGAGDSRFTFWANLCGHYGVGLPLALALAFSMGVGVVGIWWGLTAGLTLVAIALVRRFLKLSSRPIEAL